MEINDDLLTNDRGSQQRFVDWAFSKINEEMKKIKALEDEFGTAEYLVPSRQNKSPTNLSDKEKIETVHKIDKLRAEGYSYKIASNLCDIAPSTYTKWKRKLT
tara:strand:+ start:139 stop:447 length:309 start_codon:yes stop_codon:yes gene_type:complete